MAKSYKKMNNKRKSKKVRRRRRRGGNTELASALSGGLKNEFASVTKEYTGFPR
jgi:hypothetical protein